ncbi:hypothetical protein AHiyo4_48590 [Arthrobacter sp. Hiyo4]|nr:hypothetical protein AHiyo4_48590 [Arthrobacter sp. Hiyo4]
MWLLRYGYQFSSSATPIMAGTATTVVIRTVSLATVMPVW